ncbi:hypothetical protein PQU92_06055 [Asticcacaulis sp. BYS171W]|uniref:Uncharacterized protein n=1 Tax=Asticcacaulis aquaticus TaxID=2984212 RepID=A0ABT5HRY3_9CAUL|nr:hypothetical protein [Asticcacaulis aquaticus]MDC7682830.1 hypothetical protein [Asticcacaulis aquaticus]
MLTVRQPSYLWVVIALAAASVVHAVAWFVARATVLPVPEALHETQRQVMLALFWMVCVSALWMIQAPKSRLKALLHVLGCAFFVCLLGSIVAFTNWMVAQNVGFDLTNLTTFSFYALLMILGQMFLSLPSAALFQQVLLAPQREAPDPVETA